MKKVKLKPWVKDYINSQYKEGLHNKSECVIKMEKFNSEIYYSKEFAEVDYFIVKPSTYRPDLRYEIISPVHIKMLHLDTEHVMDYYDFLELEDSLFE